MQNFEIMSGRDQLSRLDEIILLRQSSWPDFIRLPKEIVKKLYEWYPNQQIAILDKTTKKIVGIGNTIPLNKENVNLHIAEGQGKLLQHYLNKPRELQEDMVLCGMSVTVHAQERNNGVSKLILNGLKQICRDHQWDRMIAPIRPGLKSLYPWLSIEKYLQLKTNTGEFFDPWLRTVINSGAHILEICHHSRIIEATVKQWEIWANRTFTTNGWYAVKDAIMPIEINCQKNLGIYTEPNVWVEFDI